MKGPDNTPYAAGTFNLLVEFPVEYPFKGPKIRFQTPIYHPNVDAEGNMCVALLKSEAWKPSTKTATVLLAMRQLLLEPAIEDALVASIAEIYQQDKAQFDKLAAEHTKKHATK
ncbi:UBC-like protein [Meira miltonrushii]|uniref:UBC-like protein n=1 Tax=Meira miltonrushii TaxID=1280837 RepID=A0A316VNK9_9BASI|nr:UBC-like protein [Meira miltonrushii]PWN37701.1 UBC-like protein [Meira miltonrushii]